MRVLVTGATGRVGSRFVPRLLAWGESVRVLVRDHGRAEPSRALGADVVVGDIRDPDTRKRAVDGVDAVINLAVVLTALARGATDEEARSVHEAGVELARVGLDAGAARYVFASTQLVYGPGRGRPAREDDELRPGQHVYPAGRAAAEHALGELHRSEGLDLRVVRLGFVYGEGDPHLAESLRWAQSWPAHKRLHMIHHADVAQALIRAARSGGASARAFNAADDAPVTAAELHDLGGAALPPEAADRTLEDPWEGIVDTSRIRRELGFRPIFPTVYTAREAGAL